MMGGCMNTSINTVYKEAHKEDMETYPSPQIDTHVT